MEHLNKFCILKGWLEEAKKFKKQPKYMVGQRVILYGKEIGTIVPSETGVTSFGIWVFSPSRGYASDYALSSVSPLPGGQL